MIDTQKIFNFINIDLKDLPNKVSAKWYISPELPYFEGHFPKNPVLPAVAVLDLAVELLSSSLGMPIRFKSIGSAKFLEPIKPNDILSIELNSINGSGNWGCLLKNQDNILVCKMSLAI